MKIILKVLLSCLLCLSACRKESEKQPQAAPGLFHADALPRTSRYHVVIDSVASDFACSFTELKNGRVQMQLEIPYQNSRLTHAHRMKEIQLILRKASTHYNFDSLKYIGLGRLVCHGDPVVEITRKYEKSFSTTHRIMDYDTMKKFFMDSGLCQDLNDALSPYSFTVTDVSMEKLFFTTKEDLLKCGHMETDPDSIPENILDCILWVKLGLKGV